MIHLWNGCGDTRTFKEAAFNVRAKYHGQSGTQGVSMWLIDGQVWFRKD